MKQFLLGFTTLCCCLLFAGTALAQNSGATLPSVIGKVVDADGNALVGATILIQGTQNGTTAKKDGEYVLSNVPSNATLIFRFIGFENLEVKVDGKNILDITMKANANVMDEIVKTGFTNVPKASFTGSSVKLNAEDSKVKGVTDISKMLEGQVAGVSIQNVSGTFGAAPKVRVRGATSLNGENKPLWVIDGIVHEDIVSISNDQLTSGDPTTLLGSAVAGLSGNDIESIDILKDASATALYGARAMNGVVVVTTKRGKKGTPVISYSGNFSVQLRPNYGNYDIMNSSDQMSLMAELERKGYLTSSVVNASNYGVYGTMYNRINTFDEESGKFLLENTPEAKENFLRRYAMANTDWFKVLFRNSLVQDHSVSISAGTENSRQYGSLSYMKDQGWSIADGVQRVTINLKNDITKGRFTGGIQAVGSVRQQRAPGTVSRRSNVIDGSYDREFDINPFSYALNTSRAMTLYGEDGQKEYFIRNYAPFNILDEMDSNFINLNVADIKGQLEAGYKITSRLKWEFTGAVRYVKSDREHQIHENSNMAEAYRAAGTSVIRKANKYLYTDPDEPNKEPEVILPYGGFYNRNEDLMISFDVRNGLNYSFKKGKSDFTLLVGQQIKGTNRQKYNSTGYGMMYDQGNTIIVNYKAMKQLIESNFDYYGMSTSSDRFVAFYGNVNYMFDRRFVVSGTARYEGSNALGTKRSARWLPTWTVSAKWNLDSEQFIKDLGFVDYAAVRASYGLTASMPTSASNSAVFRNSNTKRPDYMPQDAEPIISLSRLENSELTWEKSYSGNLGLDLSLFQRRVDFTFEIFKRNSFDLISTIRTPGIGGIMSKSANYADLSTWGTEFSVGLTPVKTKDFTWKAMFTYGSTYSIVKNAQYKPTIYNMTSANGANLDGYPVKSLFSIKFAGLQNEGGMGGVPYFINEYGEVSTKVYYQSQNLQYLKFEGPVDPKYQGGISNTFTYKDFSLNVFLIYQGGNYIRLRNVFKTVYSDFDALPKSLFNRWALTGDEELTMLPPPLEDISKSRLGSGNTPYNAFNLSDARVAKGDFMRLKTLSMTYNIPSSIVSKIGFVKNASITAAGSNLFMLYADKKLNGQDPEFFESGGVAQPIQKQFTFALKLTF